LKRQVVHRGRSGPRRRVELGRSGSVVAGGLGLAGVLDDADAVGQAGGDGLLGGVPGLSFISARH
jgi:hypothetical protein